MFFNGTIENKILKVKGFKEWIEKKDGKITIEVKRVRKPRSLSQNALYWLWLEIISKDTGYDPEELHSTFKSMFLTDRTQKLPLVRSTSKLNKIQFGQYLDKIQRQASELGIILPSPEDYYEEFGNN
jgi:hypothetical protein